MTVEREDLDRVVEMFGVSRRIPAGAARDEEATIVGKPELSSDVGNPTGSEVRMLRQSAVQGGDGDLAYVRDTTVVDDPQIPIGEFAATAGW
jgi:hypothetical protein